MVDPLLFLMLSDKLNRMDNETAALMRGRYVFPSDILRYKRALKLRKDADNLRRQLDNFKAGKM